MVISHRSRSTAASPTVAAHCSDLTVGPRTVSSSWIHGAPTLSASPATRSRRLIVRAYLADHERKVGTFGKARLVKDVRRSFWGAVTGCLILGGHGGLSCGPVRRQTATPAPRTMVTVVSDDVGHHLCDGGNQVFSCGQQGKVVVLGCKSLEDVAFCDFRCLDLVHGALGSFSGQDFAEDPPPAGGWCA